MRCRHVLTLVALCTAIASPAVGQFANPYETHEELQRRRQAEQYYYQQEQNRRGNFQNIEKPRPLGEPGPAYLSNPPVPPVTDEYDPNRPRRCPRGHIMC